jgi:glycosyltransferase involved in cell wall biosynthesis
VMPQTVWIVNPYGTLPGESWATYRSTMLAEALAAHGYEVTQFISNFEHRSKTFRPANAPVLRADGYDVHVIAGSGYRSHVSFARLRHERTFAKNLLAAVRSRTRPDVLVLAEPALFYYDIIVPALVENGRTALVLDLIDIWPELFELLVPRPLRPLAPALLAPLYFWRRRLYRHAHAVVAVAQDYARLARRLVRSGAEVEVVYWSSDDRVRPTGRPRPDILELVEGKAPHEVWVIYAGTLGENYDIPSVIDLARRLSDKVEPRVTVLIAGDGPLRGLCERGQAANCVFLGRLDAIDLDALYTRCDLALSTYKGASTVAMPIKAFDYLRYGLPIVNSLGRDLGDLVESRRVGINYEAGSVDALCAAVMRLAGDPALRTEMSFNARRLAEEFSSERQYLRFVELLARVRP